MYRPPNQSNFFELINEHMNKIDSIIKEIFILGDFNINLFLNYSYIFPQIYPFSSLHQFIKVPTLTIFQQATQRGLRNRTLLLQDCLTINSFFLPKNFLGLKEACTNTLNSTCSSITRLIFFRKDFTNYLRLLKHPSSTQVAHIKKRSIKHNPQEWFDAGISEGIKNSDKLFEKKYTEYVLTGKYIMQLDIMCII